MKLLIFCVSLLVIIFSIGFEVILVMGYSSIDELKMQRPKLLYSNSLIERLFSKCFFWASDNRPLLCVFGVIGLMISLLIN